MHGICYRKETLANMRCQLGPADLFSLHDHTGYDFIYRACRESLSTKALNYCSSELSRQRKSFVDCYLLYLLYSLIV